MTTKTNRLDEDCYGRISNLEEPLIVLEIFEKQTNSRLVFLINNRLVVFQAVAVSDKNN